MRDIDDKFLLECALASERTYFSLAAEEHTAENFLFAAVPGFGNLPAASVCLLGAENFSVNTLAQAVAQGEDAFARAGARTARFYTKNSEGSLTAFMEEKLYRRRTEIIHAITPLPADPDDLSHAGWRKVTSEQD